MNVLRLVLVLAPPVVGVLLSEVVQPAEAVSNSLSGGAGWVGAGLLGAVLAWLLFVHLPAKDKQLKELIEAKDKQVLDTIAACNNTVERVSTRHNESDVEKDKSRRADFTAALQAVITNCQREAELVHGIVKTDLAQQTAAIVQVQRTMAILDESIANARNDARAAWAKSRRRPGDNPETEEKK